MHPYKIKKNAKVIKDKKRKEKKMHTDKLLDEALKDTFPASDAIAKY